ncbi:MAG: hypothetical protein ABWY08_17185, partial [Comamonas sp.]
VISEALNSTTVLKTLSTLSFLLPIQSKDCFSSAALHCSPVFQPFYQQGQLSRSCFLLPFPAAFFQSGVQM